MSVEMLSQSSPGKGKAGKSVRDTAVRWTLEGKQEVRDYGVPGSFDYNPFNTTEDMNIGVDRTIDHVPRTQRPKFDMVKLLTEPLSRDLPTVDKDLLIVVASYYGDIDRYARLRRPNMVHDEEHCCVRGIYRNTTFAIWWSRQKLEGSLLRTCGIDEAIEARYIMNNVLYRVKPAGERFNEPYVIWYPVVARSDTYRKLAELRPKMIPQIIIACIVANYQWLFNALLGDAQPRRGQIFAVRESSNPYYLKILEERKEKGGLSDEGNDCYRSENLDGREGGSRTVDVPDSLNYLAPRC